MQKTLAIFLLLVNCAFADVIALRDGRIVRGSFVGGDARTVRIAVGDRVENYPVSDVKTITFDDGGYTGASSGYETRATQPAPAPVPPPVLRQPPDDRNVRAADRDRDNDRGYRRTIPNGAALTVRMIDDVDSERDSVGKTYRATLDEPVNDADGNTLVQRGADVTVKLVDDKQSGKIEGRTVLTLDIVSLMVDGRAVDVDTASVTEQSGSRTARSGKVIGGTAALGAVIGAIAGGGKGAAIGAASGAGVGTAAQVMTKGQRVRIPSETRLTFTLQQAVRL